MNILPLKRTWEAFTLKFLFQFSKKHWQETWGDFLGNTMAFLGSVMVLIRLYDTAFDKKKSVLSEPSIFWGILVLALGVALLRNSPKLCWSHKIKDKDVFIHLRICNLIYQDADLVIATNSTFETSYSKGFIYPDSVQGQLCSSEYKAVEQLDKELEAALEGVDNTELLRPGFKSKQYPIGTIAKLTHKNRKSYWLALSDANEHGKPTTTEENFYSCLNDLWFFIEDKGNLNDVAVPILGSGRSGLNLERDRIIKDIVLSFVHQTKDKKIVDSLTICIHPSDLRKHKLNLEQLARYVEYQCTNAFDKQALGNSSTSIN